MATIDKYESPYQKLDVALLLARENMPYMAMALHSLQPREMPGVRTMAVTKDAVMLFEPKYVEMHNTEWLAADLLHECFHLLFKHMERAAMQGALPGEMLWNWAADMCINENLREAEKAIVVKAGGRKFHIGAEGEYAAIFPENLEQEPNLVEEERYRLLRDKKKSGGEAQNGVGGGKCGSCAGVSCAVDGEPENEGRSEAELVRIREVVADAVQKYAKAHGIGTMPAGLVRWAGATLRPAKIDWRVKLTRFVRAAVAYKAGQVDVGWNKPSRRQGGIGFGPGKAILPALRAPVPRVCVVLDTSGSMGEAELQAALAEVDGVLKSTGAEVTVVVCDAQVHGVKKVATVTQAAAMLKGGGGTSMQPALEAAAALRPKPGIVIVCTDGEIPTVTMPEPSFKTVWVVISERTDRVPCSWGEQVNVAVSR